MPILGPGGGSFVAAIPASASAALLQVGPGPWDGLGSGHFTGIGAGTGIGTDLPSGSTANHLDLQVAGVRQVAVTSGGLLQIGASGFSTNYQLDIQAAGAGLRVGQTVVGQSINGIFNASDSLRKVNFGGPAGQRTQIGSPDGVGFLLGGSGTASWALSAAGQPLSVGTAPGVAAGAGAGTSPPSPICSGTDVRAVVSWGTGTSAAAGNQVSATFAVAFGSAPVVVATPLNAATAALLPYISGVGTSGYTVSTQAAPASSAAAGTYSVSIHVIG